ncbi:MAG: hypothetical protein R3A48_24275 [Polyangiales bacterium]
MHHRAWLAASLILVACSDDSGRFFPPESDASAETDATVDDVTASDIVTQDLPAQDIVDVVVDRPAPVDRGVNRCPSGCATSGDCNPCAERAGEVYCCVSGLCVFSSETTCASPPDAGGVGDDGGADGGDGAPADTSGNPFDDAGGDDGGGMMPPEDVPAGDADMDGGASGDAAADVGNDLATADAEG